MRKAVVLALALGVALPVAAHAQNADDRHQHHDDRGGGGDKHDRDHGDRGGQPQRAPGPGPAVRGPDQRGGDNRIQAAPGINRLDGHTPHSDGRGYPMPVPNDYGRGGQPGAAPDRGRGGDPQANWNRDRQPQPGGWDRDHQPRPGNWDGDHRPPPGGWDRDHHPAPGGWDRDHPAPGTWDRDHRAPVGYDRGYGGYNGYRGRDWRPGAPGGGWNPGWRQDQRFDWQRYRTYNRDRFRVPHYYAPRGYDYGYRRWYPGTRIAPYFFAQQYLISDPFFYRLPPPPPGCAWVRYYNDVALVDLGDGQVIDVISNFFY